MYSMLNWVIGPTVSWPIHFSWKLLNFRNICEGSPEKLLCSFLSKLNVWSLNAILRTKATEEQAKREKFVFTKQVPFYLLFVIGSNGIPLYPLWLTTNVVLASNPLNRRRQGFCASHGLLLWKNIFGTFFRIWFLLALEGKNKQTLLRHDTLFVGQIANEHLCRVYLERNINIRILTQHTLEKEKNIEWSH